MEVKYKDCNITMKTVRKWLLQRQKGHLDKMLLVRGTVNCEITAFEMANKQDCVTFFFFFYPLSYFLSFFCLFFFYLKIFHLFYIVSSFYNLDFCAKCILNIYKELNKMRDQQFLFRSV